MSTFHIYCTPTNLPDELIEDINNVNGRVVSKEQPVIITDLETDEEIISIFEKHGFNEIQIIKAERHP